MCALIPLVLTPCAHSSTGDALELCGEKLFQSLSSCRAAASFGIPVGDNSSQSTVTTPPNGFTWPPAQGSHVYGYLLLLSINTPWRAVLSAIESLTQHYVDREAALQGAHDIELSDMLEELRTSQRRNKVRIDNGYVGRGRNRFVV